MAQPAPNLRPSAADRPTAPAGGLLSLAAWLAIVLLAVLAVSVLVPLISRERSLLTSPGAALPSVAVTIAVFLVLAYPLWPGALLGDGPSAVPFWRWFALRVAEVALLLAVATPFALMAAVFSGAPLGRVPDLLAGLSGTAMAAVTYRLVHRSLGDGWRAVALLDAVLFLFGPLVLGYLLLEFYGISIGWCWLISPLALAVELSEAGLRLGAASFYVGVVGYSAVTGAGLAAFWAMAKRTRRDSSGASAA